MIGYKYNADYIYDFGRPGKSADLVRTRIMRRGQWWSADLQITRTLFEKHKVILGLYYEDNIQQDQETNDREVYLDDERSSTNYALYLQDEFRILSNLILNVGCGTIIMRRSGTRPNPRAGLIWSPFEKTTSSCSTGSAFRSPNVYELTIRRRNYPKIKP